MIRARLVFAALVAFHSLACAQSRAPNGIPTLSPLGSVSLHICVLGVRGVQRLYAGYGRPTKLKHFVTDEDSAYGWLKPAIDNGLPGGWTLFDLRPMRFQNLGSVDPGMERLIYGYDFLVIVPELTPADPIE